MARSYSALCKRAGLPAPTGFAELGRSIPAPRPAKSAPSKQYKPIEMTPHMIEHTAKTFMACCDAKTVVGPYMQAAIPIYLAELRDIKAENP